MDWLTTAVSLSKQGLINHWWTTSCFPEEPLHSLQEQKQLPLQATLKILHHLSPRVALAEEDIILKPHLEHQGHFRWKTPPTYFSSVTLGANPQRDTRGSSLIPRVIWTLTLYTRRWQSMCFLKVQNWHFPGQGTLIVYHSEDHGGSVTRVTRPQAKVRNRWRPSVPAVPGAVRDGILHLGKPRSRQAERLPRPRPLVE